MDSGSAHELTGWNVDCERTDPERETVETAELFNDLRMERTAHPLKPLLEGRWQ